jgi:hypothetical protein
MEQFFLEFTHWISGWNNSCSREADNLIIGKASASAAKTLQNSRSIPIMVWCTHFFIPITICTCTFYSSNFSMEQFLQVAERPTVNSSEKHLQRQLFKIVALFQLWYVACSYSCMLLYAHVHYIPSHIIYRSLLLLTIEHCIGIIWFLSLYILVIFAYYSSSYYSLSS